MRKHALPTIERLREAFRYEDVSGEIHWRCTGKGRSKNGTRAGTFQGRYMFLYLDRVRISFHRAVWALVNGEWPTDVIDHINGNTRDNRIENLRCVTQSLNMQNQRKARSDSSSGLLGAVRVCMKRGTKWRAQLRAGGVMHRGRVRSTPEEAHSDYLRMKRDLHEGATI